MGRVRSLRIAGSASAIDETISGNAGAVLHGVIVNAINPAADVANGSGNPIEIRAYEDNTGTGTTNLIWRYSYIYVAAGAGANPITQGSHLEFSLPDGVWCKSGLRIELDAGSTNMELFVLYS